jgi:mono/diheme cytochrome c family protein
LAAALGCADFSRGQPSVDAGLTADAGGTSDGGALTFAAAIYPLLTICMNCHVAGGAASDTSLIFSGKAASDYTTVLQFVDTAAPASSRILSKISGNGHGGGTIYAVGTTQYQTIAAWIQQGAPP